MTLSRYSAGILTGLLLASCASTATVFEAPTTTTSPAEITSITFDEVEVRVPFARRNTQSVPATFQNGRYFVVVAADTLTNGSISGRKTLVPDESDNGRFDITIPYKTLFDRFGSFGDRETVPMQIATTFDAKPATAHDSLAVASTAVTDFELPILQRPEVYIETLTLKTFTLARAELEVRLRIVNPNPVPVTVNSTQFELTVDGTRWHQQSLPQSYDVPVRSDIVIAAPFEMLPRNFGTDVYRKLNMSQEFVFHVNGTTQISVTLPGFTTPESMEFNLQQSQQFQRLRN